MVEIYILALLLSAVEGLSMCGNVDKSVMKRLALGTGYFK